MLLQVAAATRLRDENGGVEHHIHGVGCGGGEDDAKGKQGIDVGHVRTSSNSE